jgi:hypothetical protein
MIDNTQPPIDAGGGEAAPETKDQKAQRLAIIEAFASIVKDKRKEAIEARRASGIEEEWTQDEEHYNGIDDANRNSAPRMLKGRSTTDGLRDVRKDNTTRSTVFLKITRPYVDAAAARVSDMLLPSDDRNFAIKPTPRPELTSLVKQAQEAAQQPPQPTQPPQQPGMLRGMIGRMFGGGQPPQPAPQQGQQQQPTAVDQAAQTLATAKAAAERAQEEIDDWLVQCRYHAEVRKVIESAAKVGTGILKGPQPELMRYRAAKQMNGAWAVEMVEEIAPTSKWVNHWNFYPDGSCGDNIQKGSGVWECDDITARKLVELKSDPTYLAEMIEACIEEGPISAVDGTKQLKAGAKTENKDLFQIWYFHGQVSKKDMEAAGCSCDDKELYPAVVTMVNDRIIKVTLSPLDSGEFPYDVMVWQARPDHWAGIGVARQMRECQKGANAAVRNLMDNAGLSAGPQIIIDRNKVIPANGKYEITPRKVWYSKMDEDVGDVRTAFMIVSIETRQEELMNILQFWLKEAEDVTGMPMLLQGQQGKAPDTVGGMEMLNNNGSSVLRRLARTFDDRVTEPHIGRYYEWLLLYGPDEAKGDFTVDARGSSALVERDSQAQQLVQLLGLSVNPAYGIDPEQTMEEVLKSWRLDPKAVQLSDEKKAEMANQQPPPDPRIQIAQINAKVKEDEIVAEAQIEKMKMQGASADAQQERDLKRWIAMTEAQLADASLTADQRNNLDDLKATLTGVALKIKAQTDLAMADHTVDIHKHNNPSPIMPPPVQVPGRAPNGKAFEQV